MINIFLQYSYGGFKTFLVEGQERNERVNKEVLLTDFHVLPDDAYCFFQYGGAKIAYRYISDGRIALIIREIPSIHRDSDGRNIPCAVQFIGDPSDRNTLDYITTDIANDIEAFHNFFSNLFSVRDGLFIDGDSLRSWINQHAIQYSCESPISQIKEISRPMSDGVMFFVPLSSNFGIDRMVTNIIKEELKLPIKQIVSDKCFINMSSLYMLQGKSIIKPAKLMPEADKVIHQDNSNVNGWYHNRRRKIVCIIGIALILAILILLYIITN